MADFKEPHPFHVPTALTGKKQVQCPICTHDKFLDSGPEDEEMRKTGFEHVMVAVVGRENIAYSPVRFKYCANCGHIIQFVIGKFKEESDDSA